MGNRSTSCWKRVPQGVHPDVRLVQDGWRQAAFLVEQGEHQVLGINLLVAVLNGNGLGRSDGLLQFFGESVEIHGMTHSSDNNLSVLLSTKISIPP